MITVTMLLIGGLCAQAKCQENLEALNREVKQLYGQGKYPEATEIARRSLALAERQHGPEHPNTVIALRNLAELHRVQRRFADAEPLMKRELAILEKRLGHDNPEIAGALNSLAVLYRAQGRYAEAEQLYKRALAIREKALGPVHPEVGQLLTNLGALYQSQGRYSEAEPLIKRALNIREKALGPEHLDVGHSLNSLAELYRVQGRHREAEPLYRRAVSIFDRALGPDHPNAGTSLNNLAELYRAQGRYAEAEPLYKRSLATAEKMLGPDHPGVGTLLNNLASLYLDQHRNAEAEPLIKRALSIREKALGPRHPDVSHTLTNLASLYLEQGRNAEAEPLLKRALSIRENALGPDHPNVGQSLNNLAWSYSAQDRYSEAEPLYKRGLAIAEKTLGPEHPDVSLTLNNLAWLAFKQRDWAGAADLWRRGTALIQRRVELGHAGDREGSSKGEAQRASWQFLALIKATHRAASIARADAAPKMFEAAQWAMASEAAASLSLMAARGASGSPALASLIRERQDLVAEWQVKDRLHIAAKTEPTERRNAAAEKLLRDRLAAIDARLAAIDTQLAKHFPNYGVLASPKPISAADLQKDLREDEALALFLDTPEWQPTPGESFIWVLTKTDMRWVHADLGTAQLTREVAALRCGLDASAWYEQGRERCANLLALEGDQASAPRASLPFDHARAHRLYVTLFGEVRDLIKDKHLLIVPSGPLTQLPFHVLITRPPAGPDHRTMAWLARDHAITILPAASSLRALRRVGMASAATKPMAGFGNPLLDGPNQRYAENAKLARAKQRCPTTQPQQIAAGTPPRATAARVTTRSGLVEPQQLRAQTPLHETADELCAVAQDLKAKAEDVRLGAQATEREIKRLSASGELAKYRIVHFATHGVLAGELDGSSEPGLILTPPEKPTEEDDGYLTASEVAQLKLNADWVILSACNTAAGGATEAEALSGLARAFFYAQARALLVSHWAVDSDATVKLITSAVAEIARDPTVGRAEGLRRSMSAMIDKSGPREAHPSYWAPFIVVGEGAAQR